jgi:hypothetical protein
MNLMRSILLFVWVLGCSSRKLRHLSKHKCVEVLEDREYEFLECVNGSAAQEFLLEGERVRNPKSGNCLPSTGVEMSKLAACSRGHPNNTKLYMKVEGTTVKNSEGFCLFGTGDTLSFCPCDRFDNTKTKKVAFE